MSNQVRARGLIIAAPSSGSGKTLVTLSLLSLLKARGVKVVGCKAGPDYIDPEFHAAATGLDCFNLDIWAMRQASLGNLLSHQAALADLVIVEGVMGLFDGVPGMRSKIAEISPPVIEPVYIDTSRIIASAGAMKNVKGRDRAISIDPVRPGIAPTTMPANVPPTRKISAGVVRQ